MTGSLSLRIALEEAPMHPLEVRQCQQAQVHLLMAAALQCLTSPLGIVLKVVVM